jgi:hypothetical protein
MNTSSFSSAEFERPIGHDCECTPTVVVGDASPSNTHHSSVGEEQRSGRHADGTDVSIVGGTSEDGPGKRSDTQLDHQTCSALAEMHGELTFQGSAGAQLRE